MLSEVQRTKIRGALESISEYLDVTFLPERQVIENLDDFPLAQVTFLTEGIRQVLWQDLLHETQDTWSHEWTEYHGHYARASVSVSMRATDLDELQHLAKEFASTLWKVASSWRLEVDDIEFRGGATPKFLPPYLAKDERTFIYGCVIDFYVDYEFSWEVTIPPITDIHTSVIAGLIDTEDYSPEILLTCTAPGCYLMIMTVTGDVCSYRMTTTID
jgi:hypothetical protein